MEVISHLCKGYILPQRRLSLRVVNKASIPPWLHPFQTQTDLGFEPATLGPDCMKPGFRFMSGLSIVFSRRQAERQTAAAKSAAPGLRKLMNSMVFRRPQSGRRGVWPPENVRFLDAALVSESRPGGK